MYNAKRKEIEKDLKNKYFLIDDDNNIYEKPKKIKDYCSFK